MPDLARKDALWFRGGSMTPFSTWRHQLSDLKYLILLVPLAGLEPARCFHHLILSQKFKRSIAAYLVQSQVMPI